jgi:hypothetical protein
MCSFTGLTLHGRIRRMGTHPRGATSPSPASEDRTFSPRAKNRNDNNDKSTNLVAPITIWSSPSEPLCALGRWYQDNLNDPNWADRRAERSRYGALGGNLPMIHRHGIGVIQTDEWVSPDPRTCIRIPSTVHMAKVINLRAARKRAVRLQDEQRAAERRVQFGVPKAERLLAKARAEKGRRGVDHHRIGNGEGR